MSTAEVSESVADGKVVVNTVPMIDDEDTIIVFIQKRKVNLDTDESLFSLLVFRPSAGYATKM